jgi:hypothetical protein
MSGDSVEASWESTMAELRRSYPTASEGILFCVRKLQQDPHLTLRDFRDEARLHGLSLGGRALHSARVLLGLEQPAKRRTKAELALDKPARRTVTAKPGASVEDTLIAAVQEIQDTARRDSHRLRLAIQQAIDILQRALDER